MSNYLANIASRSTQSGNTSITPSDSATRDSDPLISGIEYFDGTDSSSESGNSNEYFAPQEHVQEKTDQFLPKHPPLQPSMHFHKSEEIKTEKKIELPYFKQHIERMTVQEHNVFDEKIQLSGEDSNHSDGKIPLIEENKLPYKVLNNSTLVANKSSVEKLTPEQEPFDNEKPVVKPVILPAFKPESVSNTKEIITSIRPERLSPSEPAQASNPQVHRKNNQQAPKLVIGKITVEIVPLVVQPSPKIITRVVQSPPTENHSKTNRLSFGLGQL